MTTEDIRSDATGGKIIEAVKESKIERDHLNELKQVLLYLGEEFRGEIKITSMNKLELSESVKDFNKRNKSY